MLVRASFIPFVKAVAFPIFKKLYDLGVRKISSGGLYMCMTHENDIERLFRSNYKSMLTFAIRRVVGHSEIMPGRRHALSVAATPLGEWAPDRKVGRIGVI